MSDSDEQGFFERVGEFLSDNGRTVVSVIVIGLLIGTGIYAYTRDDKSSQTASIDDKIDQIKSEEEAQADNTPTETTETPTTPNPSTPTDTQIISVNPDTSDTTVQAGNGDGVTHLARTAVSQYISDEDIQGIEPGHRVFMETTLTQNAEYYQVSLEPGQEITFKGTDLSQVVTDAQALLPDTLARWAVYAQDISEY